MHPQERHHYALPLLADGVLGVLYLGVGYMICGITLVHLD
jgi:hypothetical protein